MTHLLSTLLNENIPSIKESFTLSSRFILNIITYISTLIIQL